MKNVLYIDKLIFRENSDLSVNMGVYSIFLVGGKFFIYIFLIYCFYHHTCLCNTFYGLSALVGCWSSAFITRIIYKFLNVCSFDYTAFAISGMVGIP